MHFLSFQFGVYLVCLVLPLVIGIRYFRYLDTGLKLIWIFILLTFVCELTAGVVGIEWHNNLVVYHVYTPLCLALFCAYYHYRLTWIRRYRLAYLIAIAGIAVEILDTLRFDPLTTLDSNAILFSTMCIVLMSVGGVVTCIVEGKGPVRRDPHARISLLFCVFWIGFGLLLGCRDILGGAYNFVMGLVDYLWVLGILVHLGVAYVFFSFKSFNTISHE